LVSLGVWKVLVLLVSLGSWKLVVLLVSLDAWKLVVLLVSLAAWKLVVLLVSLAAWKLLLLVSRGERELAVLLGEPDRDTDELLREYVESLWEREELILLGSGGSWVVFL